MNSLQFFILIFIFVGGLLIIAYFLNKKFKHFEIGKEEQQNQGIMMLQNQLGEIRQSVESQYKQSVELTRNFTEKLSKLDQTNQQVVNFADQLQNLQDILKNPKQRGILGEYLLESVLKNVLPPKIYQMQYNLGRDEKGEKDLIVDAVIFVKDKILPIDSKFSLENYNRLVNEHDLEKQNQLEKLFKQDLKNRIDETAKYIQPQRNTFEFAFMFIPSETIYYDLLVSQIGAIKTVSHDLIEYAFKKKKVIIVSPTTLLAYLQMVLQGLRSLQIEESTKEIQKNVEELGRHIIKYDIYLQKLGNNLGTTVNAFNVAHQEFKKIDKDVFRVVGKGKSEIESLSIDRPKIIDGK